jgi:putative ABC transport system permease protein
MKFYDLKHQTWASISQNKGRSALTVLGIVIGIASVIIMLSIGQGAQSSVEDSIASIGTDILTVSPGESSDSSGLSQGQGSADTLTLSDVEFLREKLPFLEGVAPISTQRVQVVISGGTNTSVSIYGVDSSYLNVKELEMLQGDFFSDESVETKEKTVVLGYTVFEDLYGTVTTNVVGQTVSINEIDFVIAGVVDELGSRQDDNLVYAPISTVQHYMAGSNSVSSITIKVGDDDLVPVVQEAAAIMMRASHGITNPDDDDFSVDETGSFLEAASEITQIFTILLASVAGISLLVGGIGIMNMMLTTVKERTKEIGIRKSMGATEFEINIQFLAESFVLTLIGGILGVAIGVTASTIVSALGIITTTINISSILLSVGVSSFIGIVFGYYPAKQAAQLDPIEALRYE